MNQIKDLKIYNSEMNKSIEDKLWFTQFLEQPQFHNAIIVDYGCGDGTLIRELDKEFWAMFDYFGVDNNEEMLKIADSKVFIGNVYYSKSIPQLVTDRPKILILSSVLHEIFSYNHSLEFHCDLNGFKPDYIFIRDMWLDESARRNIIEDISKIEEHELFESFKKVEKFNNFKRDRKFSNRKPLDEIELDWSNIIHFLLKYRYKENWEREVKENYISIYKDRFDKIFKDYYTIYEKKYTLPFIKEQVKKDFGINLVDTTHINLILKRCN